MNRIVRIICLSGLVFSLLACTTQTATQTGSTQATLTNNIRDNVSEISFRRPSFRGTNLGFSDEVKAKIRAAEVNIVDLTLAIQHELQRQDLLVSDASYVLAVTIDELQISPLYQTALFSFRVEDDYIAARAEVLDNNRESLRTYQISAAASHKEAIDGNHQQRLAKFYKTFAEQVVAAILQ